MNRVNLVGREVVETSDGPWGKGDTDAAIDHADAWIGVALDTGGQRKGFGGAIRVFLIEDKLHRRVDATDEWVLGEAVQSGCDRRWGEYSCGRRYPA